MAMTLYDLLEVAKTASPEVIKSAYRLLAAKHHPDNGTTGNEELFKKITKAYEILSSPDKRAEYDSRLLHNEESIFLGDNDPHGSKGPVSVKRLDGSDTFCTIDEHVRRKGMELSKTDLRGLILRDISLAGGLLDGADLSHANLQQVSLHSADMTKMACVNGVFVNVVFERAALSGSSFINCMFMNCTFDHCSIEGASFVGSNFKGSTFFNTHLKSCDCSNTVFEGVPFTRVHQTPNGDHIERPHGFSNCKFVRANLRQSWLGQHTVTRADKRTTYQAIDVYCTDFTGANLSDANCQGTAFRYCDFKNATMVGANLRKSSIVKPDSFEHATLTSADFTDTSLTDIDLTTCNIVNTRFHGSRRENVTFPAGFVSPEQPEQPLHTAASAPSSPPPHNRSALKSCPSNLIGFGILLSLLIAGALVYFGTTADRSTAPSIPEPITAMSPASNPPLPELIEKADHYVIEKIHNGISHLYLIIDRPEGVPGSSLDVDIQIEGVVKDIAGAWQIDKLNSYTRTLPLHQGEGQIMLPSGDWKLSSPRAPANLMTRERSSSPMLVDWGRWGNGNVQPIGRDHEQGMIFHINEGWTTKITVKLVKMEVGLLNNDGTAECGADVWLLYPEVGNLDEKWYPAITDMMLGKAEFGRQGGYRINAYWEPNHPSSSTEYGLFTSKTYSDVAGIATFYVAPGSYTIYTRYGVSYRHAVPPDKTTRITLNAAGLVQYKQ